jgi:hypothetical protein
MEAAKIPVMLHSQPFRPFWAYLSAGGRIAVEHEDFTP